MTSCAQQTILVVEDDRRLAKLIQEFFHDQAYVVNTVHRGDTAIERIADEQPDLVILDIELPGANGFDVCRSVRQQYRGLILMLTARDDDIDQIVGLEIGADDYVNKPVDPRVLLARVRSLLRRGASTAVADDDPTLEFGGLYISRVAREVSRNGITVELTTAEFDLLWILANQAGTVLSRAALFSDMRGIEYDGQDRSIDVSVSRLRKKLGDGAIPAPGIKTVRGKGYLFVPDAW